MKQMNKSELIEFFIELLGDNEILGQIMSIEQIRAKLQLVIKDVKYDPIPNSKNIPACWNSSNGIVNLDYAELNTMPIGLQEHVIVHELLHALSTSYISHRKEDGTEYKIYKVGIHHFSPTDGADINRSINEGITDILAELITNEKNNGYKDEKDISKILSVIIGEQNILRKYFEDIDIEKFNTPYQAKSIFIPDIIENYGRQFGGRHLIDPVTKVLSLADNMKSEEIFGPFNKDEKEMQAEIKHEIYYTLSYMLEKIIDNEPDISKKADIMLSSSIVSQTMFDPSRIYDLYVQSGQISEDVFPKKEIFNKIISLNKTYNPTNNTKNSILGNTKYRQVGEYYEILDQKAVNRELYDKSGNKVETFVDFVCPQNPDTELNAYTSEKLLMKFSPTQLETLQQQLQGKNIEYEDYMSKQGKNEQPHHMGVSIEGDLLRISYYSFDKNSYIGNLLKEEFFSVNDNGSISQIIPRNKKKFFRRHV